MAREQSSCECGTTRRPYPLNSADNSSSAFGSEQPSLAVLKRAASLSLHPVAVIDCSGTLALANDAFASLWGYEKDEVAGIHPVMLWQDREEALRVLDAAYARGSWTGPIAARKKDGSQLEILLSAGTVAAGEGEPCVLLLSCSTALQVPKPEQTQSSELEKAISRISPQFIQVTDLDASIDTSLSILGEAADACRVYLVLCDTGRTVAAITHEWCRAGTVPRKGTVYPLSEGKRPWWMSVVENGELLQISEQTGKHGDLIKRLGVGAALMLPVSMGNVVAGFISFERKERYSVFTIAEQDLLITAARIIGDAFERKQVDYCLKEYERLYHAILETMEDMVFVADTDQRIILANTAFKEWVREHSPVADPVGANISDVVPYPPDATRRQYDRLQKAGKRESGEKECRVGDRNILLYETRIPVFERGQVSCTITIIRDITRQREIETMKNRAYSQIERNMEQFAILADNVRNPLQVIQGMADLIEDEKAVAISEQVRKVNRIITQLDDRWVESRKISSFWRRYS